MSSTYTVPFKVPVDNVLKKIILAFQFAYGIASFFLMIYMFIHLARSKKYSNSFYRLVQVDLIVNTVCWCNTWISVRSFDLEIGENYLTFFEKWLPGTWNVSAFLANFFFHMQFCSAAAMSVHRVTAIFFYSTYDKFWRRWFLFVYLLLIGYSILPQLGGLPSKLSLVNETLYITTNIELNSASGKRLAICAVVYFVLLIALGGTVARIAFKKLEAIHGTNGDQSVSKKLTKIALTYAILYSGIPMWTIGNFVHTNFIAMPLSVYEIWNALMTVASDMITLSLPYVLLLFDMNIKSDVKRTTTLAVIPSVMPTQTVFM
uniref:Serpentine receptor class gamma n=1 Tax=Caenorhabditis tropicalis TaxID=1561998 RepID=A0A1I7UBF7_9PELO